MQLTLSCNSVFGSENGVKKNETINVFSVASGHLYERFLSIMMISVKKQTQQPLKFWLIENFLSPSFMVCSFSFLFRKIDSFLIKAIHTIFSQGVWI